LAITAKGGVALLEGLEISSCVVGNKSLEAHLDGVRERISNGSSFGRSIRDTNAFSGLVVRMIEVGEDSGQLPLVLDKVSEVYDGEVNRAIAKMTSLIEPLIIVIFAFFVTTMVLALYMPVFSMSGQM
jgi:type IV pilus assembly protein PilC